MNHFLLISTVLLLASFGFGADVGTLLVTNSNYRESPGDLMLVNLKIGAIDTLVKAHDTLKPYFPCFSPDGRRVAFTNKVGKKIRIFNLFTRQITALGPDSTPYAPLCWVDSFIYTNWKASGTLRRINVYSGVVDSVYAFQAKDVWPTGNPSIYAQGNMSSDGRRGCYTLDGGFNAVYAFDLDSKTEKLLVSTPSCQAAMSPSGRLAVGTGHVIDRIRRVGNNSELSLGRNIYNYTFWFNRWSYNSEYDLIFFNAKDSFFVHSDLLSNRTEKLIKGLCVWNIDVRGWVLDTLVPTAPSSLTAGVTERTVTLSWQRPVSDKRPSRYGIERDGIAIKTVGDVETFTDSGLIENHSYTYSVIGLTDGVGRSAPLTGHYTTAQDKQPPKLLGAFSYGDSIDVVFSEPLDSVSAVKVANYSLSSPVVISSVQIRDQRRVCLRTNSFSSLTDSFLHVTGVKDKAQTANTISRDSIPVTIVRGLSVSTGRSCVWNFVDSLRPFNHDDALNPAQLYSYGDCMYAPPSGFTGWPYFSNSYKDGNADSTKEFLRFTLSRAVEVCVGVHHVLGVPPWLVGGGWVKTGQFISEYDLYAKRFDAGTVSLKGSGRGDYSSYITILRPVEYSLVASSRMAPASTAARVSLKASPHPFDRKVMIRISGLSSPKLPEIRIYDLAGRMVASPKSAVEKSGHYLAEWNGMDATGNPLSAGIYFCRLESDLSSKSLRLIKLP